MTPLGELLVTRIRQTGPMSIAEFMAECLMHPRFGYYSTHDPFGAGGDFTTAPEISQMFGEIIGLSLAQAWMDRGSSAAVNLVELGPGRGTLMADILRATQSIPGFLDAVDVHLVETSPALRAQQSKTISTPFTHHNSLEDVPEGPLLLIANEFFDAMPTRQFQRTGDAWRERIIGLQEGALAFGLSDQTAPAFLADRIQDTKDNDIVEHAPASQAIASEIGHRIDTHGGLALIIDYGDWRSLGDTLQALSNHQSVSPLDTPGQADLTTHVDFEAIARAASPAKHSRVTPQGVFLERLGITHRAQVLAKSLQGDALDNHIKAHRRLTHPEEMGTLFKAMAIYKDTETLPPGFEP
ncbi:MAG: class I SAM-dependent methyltransferase [Silicimonas sp.]|nr:class I SAM-dependent methyltransferase [Silicimonas sp.]